MCLCCAPFERLFHYLPYIWLFSVPLCGILWGPVQSARQSIFMFVFILISSMISKDLKKWIPCLDTVIFICLMLFPFTLLPEIVVWLYANCMWLVEPVLLCIESYQIVITIRSSGQWLAELAQEKDYFGKVAVLLITAFAYLLAIPLLTYICYSYTFSKIWVFLVCATYIAILVGFTIYNDYGIISDSALVTLFASVVLLAAVKETNDSLDFSKESPSSVQKSYLLQLLELPIATTASSNNSLSLVKELFSPTIWILLAVRVYSSVKFLVSNLPQQSSDDFDEYCNNDDRHRYSVPLVNLTVIFLYSQTVVKTLMAPSFYITAGRYIQAIGIGVFYVISLQNQDDVWQ